ncbi:MAG TPA: transposase [Sphingopyxis sp.]|nr:transposase [Sphingopyxis sp.]HMP45891.1 transposase [Sphingopyxis sp.]HMQ20597.1 transposase [Sphingopyxis sp.]
MTGQETFVGIDVSKARLDACLWPDGEVRSFVNDRQGLRDLVRWLRGLKPQAVGFEASGGYERPLLAALCEAGLPARRINPVRLRQFARAAGMLAKNDRIDAGMIARFCAVLPQRETRHDPVLATLAELVTARRQLCEERTRCANQAEQTSQAMLKRIGLARIKRLAAEILLAFMPELGAMSGRQAAALVGVAPYDCESGSLKGQRRIFGGRKPLRDALYMAALVASRCNTPLRNFYQRLRNNGKPPKCALVATIRKLVTCLNAMLRDNHVWNSA